MEFVRKALPLGALLALAGCAPDATAPLLSNGVERASLGAVDNENAVAPTWTVQALDVIPQADNSEGRSINAGGDIVGRAYGNRGAYTRGVMWIGETPTNLGVPLGATFYDAFSINDSRTIAGYTDFGAAIWKAGV